MIIVTDKLFKLKWYKSFGAITIFFIIFIRSEHKDDVALIEHEKIHVKQFFRTFGLHGLFYKFSKKYRLNSEIEAYRRQIEVLKERGEFEGDETIRKMVLFIVENYKLNLSPFHVKMLLTK